MNNKKTGLRRLAILGLAVQIPLAGCGGGSAEPAAARAPQTVQHASTPPTARPSSSGSTDLTHGKEDRSQLARQVTDQRQLPFAGKWSGTFSGSESGVCAGIAVSPVGSLSGSCEMAGGESFQVTGVVSPQGEVHFNAQNARDGIAFTGKFTTTAAAGTWARLANSEAGGMWSLSLRY